MIRIALCDDEVQMLDEASLHIERYTECRRDTNFEVFRFDCAKSLRNALDDGRDFDIFILDVYIGDEMGTSLAKDIRRRGIDSPVIFLTTSVEHAPQGYEMGTLRYLIKPLDPVKLYEALDAALVTVERIREKHIKLKTENGIESINSSRVMYSESQAHYQHITLENGERIRVRMTVSELYTTLMKSGGFVRVGSAYIINLRKIKNVSTSEVHLYNNISIPIPRGKHTEIKKAFWDYQCDGEE